MTRRHIPGLQRDVYQALLALDQPEAERRVRTLAAQGMSEREIARLTGLHLVVVRRILSGPSLSLVRDGA
jgi:DNA invertase Pin-like site-specific DNA recombinase